MFFFSYQCCMKKNDIAQDTPNYPSDDDDAITNDSTQEDKDPVPTNPFGGQ